LFGCCFFGSSDSQSNVSCIHRRCNMSGVFILIPKYYFMVHLKSSILYSSLGPNVLVRTSCHYFVSVVISVHLIFIFDSFFFLRNHWSKWMGPKMAEMLLGWSSLWFSFHSEIQHSCLWPVILIEKCPVSICLCIHVS